ncbi:MAG: acyltransferase [Planctomycetota bacterium]|nr:acyltransferase [Planctomycetota bacterium]
MIRLMRFLLLDLPIAARGVLWRLAVGLMGGRLGPGARIYGGARIFSAGGGSRIEIGANFRLLRFAIVNSILPGAKVVIGKWVHIGEASMVTAGESVEIGDDVVIGPQTIIVDADHACEDVNQPIRVQGLVTKPIRIEQGVWLGGHVNVLKGVTIGRGAIIGAGSTVTRDIPPYAIAVGVPARVIRYRPDAPQPGKP